MSHIVIIGGSYAGAKVAHGILKDISTARITLIDPSDIFYFNIASPRVIAKPKEVSLDKVLIPIAEKFKHYPNGKFAFVQGLVPSVDLTSKVVQMKNGQSIAYDYLVVASGSTAPSTVGPEGIPFKAIGNHDIRRSIVAAQSRVAEAEDIAIIGAGPVGVETGGDFAQAYPQKRITLIASHDRVLNGLKTSASKAAEKSLHNLGIHIIYSARVTRTDRVSSSGKSKVHLQNGKLLDAALVISAAGNITNTSFMPKASLDSEGWVQVDKYLGIPSAPDGSAFALGDVTTFKQRYMMKVLDQVPVVTANIKASLAKSGSYTLYDSNDKLMVLVPIGAKSGTGQLGGWVPFSFMVAFVKGKDYFISKAASHVSSA